MNEQLIEKLKELINDINTFEQINKKYTNSILSEAIQALTSVKSESAEEEYSKWVIESKPFNLTNTQSNFAKFLLLNKDEFKIGDLETIFKSVHNYLKGYNCSFPSKLSAEEVLKEVQEDVAIKKGWESWHSVCAKLNDAELYSWFRTNVLPIYTDRLKEIYGNSNSADLLKQNELLKNKINEVGEISLAWFKQLEEIDNLKRTIELQNAQIEKSQLDWLCIHANQSQGNNKDVYNEWIKQCNVKDLTKTQSEFAKWLCENQDKLKQIGDLKSIFESIYTFLKYKSVYFEQTDAEILLDACKKANEQLKEEIANQSQWVRVEEAKQSLEKKARDWEFQNRESEDSDYHSYRAGYNQAMYDFANKSEQKEQISLEDIRLSIKHSLRMVIYKFLSEWKSQEEQTIGIEEMTNSLMLELSPVISILETTANNSKAMKQHAIGYKNHFEKNVDGGYIEDEEYNKYLTNKEK